MISIWNQKKENATIFLSEYVKAKYVEPCVQKLEETMIIEAILDPIIDISVENATRWQSLVERSRLH